MTARVDLALRAEAVKAVVDPLGHVEVFFLEVETAQARVKLAFDANLARTAAHALFAGIRSLNQGGPA